MKKKNIVLGLISIFVIFLMGCVVSVDDNSTATKTNGAAKELPVNALLVIDSSNSKLLYEAGKIVGEPHIGTVDVSEGILLRKSGEFIEGSFTVDMTTFTEEKNNERFLGHIEGEDFFNIELYPTSKFEIVEIVEVDGLYVITGDLTILDKTQSITFPSRIRYSGDQIRAVAIFEIDRLEWGISYNSGSIVKDLGDKAIKDNVKFALDLMFDINQA